MVYNVRTSEAPSADVLGAVTKSEGGIVLDETIGAAAPVEDMLTSDAPAQDTPDSVAPSEDVVVSEAPTGEQFVAAAGSEDCLLLKGTLGAAAQSKAVFTPEAPAEETFGTLLSLND